MSVPKNLAFLVPEILARPAIAGRARTLPVPAAGRPAGYLTYGPDAANVLFHVVNDRHLRKRPMIFTTNKPLTEWGKVLHDED
ncbi:MAG TPA: ATP-binding protein, partial [Candidatus Acidoferrales bacterium]|nr:ATP-binding protein [Candidatus Acidoferrales bacterium]